jgi:hypothetical protein
LNTELLKARLVVGNQPPGDEGIYSVYYFPNAHYCALIIALHKIQSANDDDYAVYTLIETIKTGLSYGTVESLVVNPYLAIELRLKCAEVLGNTSITVLN